MHREKVEGWKDPGPRYSWAGAVETREVQQMNQHVGKKMAEGMERGVEAGRE